MEAALTSIGLLSPATVTARTAAWPASRRSPASTPGELLQVANVACWKWAAGTAAETVEHGRRALAAARAQAADASDSIPIYEALWVLCYADAHELALSVLDDTLADARARGSVFGISTSCALRALIALAARRRDPAEQEARTATVLPGLSDFVRPPLFGVLALALVARGDLDGAEAAIAESGCGPSLPEFVCLNPVVLRARRAAAAQGRHEEALADFTEFGERSARIPCATRATRGGWGPPRACRGAAARRRRRGSPTSSSSWRGAGGRRPRSGSRCTAQALAHGGAPEALAEAAEVLGRLAGPAGPCALPRRPRRRAAAGQPAHRGARAAARRARAGPPLRRRCARAARPRRARGRRRPAAPADVQRAGGADAERAARGRAGRRGA